MYASWRSRPYSALDDPLTLPEAEVRQVLRTYAEAIMRAETGEPTLGYAMLLQGLDHAEKALVVGEPWGRALSDCWRNALDRFSERQEVADE